MANDVAVDAKQRHPRLGGYYDYGYYGGGCSWLYRNAVATGSPYWWNRYQYCIGY